MTEITVRSIAHSDTVETQGAVDATLQIEGVGTLDVTLCPPEDGSPGLATWGPSADLWCSRADLLPADPDEARDLVSEIETAVTRAAEGLSYRLERLASDGSWQSEDMGDSAGWHDPDAPLAGARDLAASDPAWDGDYRVVRESDDVVVRGPVEVYGPEEEVPLSTEVTHRVDPDTGHLVQVVPPARLREILLAQGETLDRPASHGPEDEWDVGD